MRRYLAALVIVIGLAAVGAAIVYVDILTFINTPLAISQQDQELLVSKGDSIATIAAQLEQQQRLTSALYLRLYARLNKQASRIKAGTYTLAKGITPKQLLSKLVAGDVVWYHLTVVEGWTFQRLLQALAEHKKIQHTVAGLSDAQIMAKLGYPETHPEGRFFPDTYYFGAGTSDVAFLQRSYRVMEQKLNQLWAKRKPDLPLKTATEALILASIIERETSLRGEHAKVAGVYIRRLQKGMRLQADPTVIYGLAENYTGSLRRSDLRLDGEYNTYTRNGLPPTPIALPGLAALQASMNPAPGTELYFVATGEGGHTFSTTLAAHNKAVKLYRQKLQN